MTTYQESQQGKLINDTSDIIDSNQIEVDQI